MDRRDFLKLVGIASGTSLMAGCNLDRSTEKLIPYLVPPEDGLIPGEATYTPSVCMECPVGCGVSVRVRDKRPVKLEGLGSHPINDGALCVRGQASLNRLYNPERIRQPLVRDADGNLAPGEWTKAYQMIRDALAGGEAGREHYLSGKTTGTLSTLIDEFCRQAGVKRMPEFEVFSHAAIREANRNLYGRSVVPEYRIERSDFMLTLGADIVETFVSPVSHLKQLSHARTHGHHKWVHVEPHASQTGLQADERIVVKPGSEAYLLSFLLGQIRKRRIFGDRRIENHMAAVTELGIDETTSVTGVPEEALRSLLESLLSAKHPLVIAGGVSTAHRGGLEVALLAGLLQAVAGMIGDTVDFARSQDFSTVGSLADIESILKQLDEGRTGVMFIARTDPVGSPAPGSRFGELLKKAGLIVGMGDCLTETMKACDVVLPLDHYLESWGDVQPRADLVCSHQPVIQPLFDTRSEGDILLQLVAEADSVEAMTTYQSYVINNWRRKYGVQTADALINKGFAEAGAAGSRPALRANRQRYSVTETMSVPLVVVQPSVRFYDGRSAMVPLLNEIPDPLSAVSWDRWISVSHASAAKLGLKDRDWIEISWSDWTGELPVLLQPGLSEDVYVVQRGTVDPPLGWNSETGESDAYLEKVSVRKIEKRGDLTVLTGSLVTETKGHVPLEHVKHHKHYAEHLEREDITFYPVPDYPEYRWAMSVDLDVCTGCSACVAACYIENNVPIVGREEHLKGRELSWIRIEPYYDEHDELEFIPMMCQHCDYAPCEPVCPVFATYHNDEGLNAQVYNRCVGTRYCANNCPYKARRFNWFSYDKRPEPLGMMVNPDVSLRGKGIMEKCTFCVQRIRKARDVAKDNKRKILDGEAQPACAQACPAGAITFGNLKDPESAVAKKVHSDRSHQVLDELGTGPAVYYLKTTEDDGHHG